MEGKHINRWADWEKTIYVDEIGLQTAHKDKQGDQQRKKK